MDTNLLTLCSSRSDTSASNSASFSNNCSNYNHQQPITKHVRSEPAVLRKPGSITSKSAFSTWQRHRSPPEARRSSRHNDHLSNFLTCYNPHHSPTSTASFYAPHVRPPGARIINTHSRIHNDNNNNQNDPAFSCSSSPCSTTITNSTNSPPSGFPQPATRPLSPCLDDFRLYQLNAQNLTPSHGYPGVPSPQNKSLPNRSFGALEYIWILRTQKILIYI